MSLSVDQRVGRKIRQLRWKHGTTREELASAIEVTVDQIERFELGSERVPAQTLWRIAGVFRVEVKVFFPLEADEDPSDLDAISTLADILMNREALRVIRTYDQLSTDERKQIYESAKRRRKRS